MGGRAAAGHLVVEAQRFPPRFRTNVLSCSRRSTSSRAATPCSAPRLGQTMMTIDGVSWRCAPISAFSRQPISFIGLPVVAVPTAKAGAMPIGVQVIAKPHKTAGRVACLGFSRETRRPRVDAA